MQNYKIAGKEYLVIGHAKCTDKNGNPTDETIPIVDIPQVSDYQWQLDCLNDRLEHPEKYSAFECVEERIAYLRKWLEDEQNKRKALDFANAELTVDNQIM